MSDYVTWRDARAVFHLLDDLKQARHDTLSWRLRLLSGLGSLVGAQVGLAAEAPEGRFLDPSSHVGGVDAGFGTESERRVWMSVCERTDPDLDPSDATIARLGRRSYTRRRQALASDGAWYKSVMYNEYYRRIGLDCASGSWGFGSGISGSMATVAGTRALLNIGMTVPRWPI